MNSLRISEKNKINIEIKTLESSIKRNSNTIERLSSQPYSEFNKLQIQKLKKQIENDEGSLEQMKGKITIVDSGGYDSYILQQVNENAEKSNKIRDENEKKLKEKRDKKLEEQEKIQQMYAIQNKNFNNTGSGGGRGGYNNNGGGRGGYNNNGGGGRGGYNNNGGGRGGYNNNGGGGRGGYNNNGGGRGVYNNNNSNGGGRGGYNNNNNGGGRGGYNNNNNGGGRGYNKNNETENSENQNKGTGILWELLESGGKGSGGREGKY